MSMDEPQAVTRGAQVAPGELRHYRGLSLVAAVLMMGAQVPAQADEVSELADQVEALAAVVAQQATEIEALRAALSRVAMQTEADAIGAPAPDQEDDAIDILLVDPEQPLGRFPDAAIITAGDFEGAIKIPDSQASVRLGGFVRAEGSFDFDSLGFQDVVNHRRIPLDGTPEDSASQSRFHVRNSRFNIDYRRPVPVGELRAFLEFDFFGGGDEFINNYEVRIRHVAAQVGNFYVGQWWSQFTDIAASPETVDFGPPLGQPVLRNPGLRWVKDVGTEGVWRYGFGVENPAGDLTDTQDLFASDAVPNVTGFVEANRDWGRVRVAALALRLDSDEDDTFAGGLNVTGRINTPWFADRDNIVFGLSGGEGFTHYFSVFAGAGLEGVISADGSVEATEILGGYIGYQHWWSEDWRSTFVASAVDLDAPDGSLGSAFESGERYRMNLFWTPQRDITLGLELSYAAQETFDGSEGDGTRLNAVATIDF